MSRIGKKNIIIPAGVTIDIGSLDATRAGRIVVVRGPKGTTNVFVPEGIEIAVEGNEIVCSLAPHAATASNLWGLGRSLLAGAVVGVTAGFVKRLEIEGIGYRAALEGTTLSLSLGFSHPIKVEPPAGITFTLEKNAILVSGTDKQLVGQVAASIRDFKKPEPYKGKGIRYAGEVVRRKAGKKAAVAAK